MFTTGAENIVNDCLGVDKEESVVVLSDGHETDLVEAIISAVERVGAPVELISYPETDTHSGEPPSSVAKAMADADVFIAPTRKSLTHTDARQNACAAGARGATLPGITPNVWNGALMADYNLVEEISSRLYEQMMGADRVVIETQRGTALKLQIDTEYFQQDTGLYRESGEFGNLPAGEVDGPVVRADGVIYVDHCLQAPTGQTIYVEDGEVVSTDATSEESRLTSAFKSELGARMVAELGIGTNPEAKLIGNILQDEKALETCHIAFGDNTSYVPDDSELFNRSSIHFDIILESPTVTVDGTLLLDQGDPKFWSVE